MIGVFLARPKSFGFYLGDALLAVVRMGAGCESGA
jgi:hypothetical protein